MSMLNGPGKYDDACTDARIQTKAAGVILIVIDGEKGSGFSAQLPITEVMRLPEILREMADSMDPLIG